MRVCRTVLRIDSESVLSLTLQLKSMCRLKSRQDLTVFRLAPILGTNSLVHNDMHIDALAKLQVGIRKTDVCISCGEASQE